jgi:hypothetical protein
VSSGIAHLAPGAVALSPLGTCWETLPVRLTALVTWSGWRARFATAPGAGAAATENPHASVAAIGSRSSDRQRFGDLPDWRAFEGASPASVISLHMGMISSLQLPVRPIAT